MSDRPLVIAGWTMSALFALFLIGASAVPKLALNVGAETMADLGWPDAPVFWIGVLELVLAVLFLVPRTGLLAATLTMALLGGAIVTQVRAGSPLYSHTLFGVYLGIWMWAALWLRDPSIRAVWPVRGG